MTDTHSQKEKTLRRYFKEAKSWADDSFARVELSRNRYQVAFLVAMVLNCCAVVSVVVLANLQTLVPLLVHHYDNGITLVDPLTKVNAPLNQVQVESDIVRYITHRESYDISSYRAQFDLVGLLSNTAVADEYLREQDKANKLAPINQLATTATRSIHIYSIHFLDNFLFNEKDFPKNHQNLAEVVFTLTDTNKTTGMQHSEHFNALIAWRYIEPSKAPDERWQNWDGFQVIRYSKQVRNVTRRAS